MTYTIIQEELRTEGSKHWSFWMLVACILMNRARGSRAREILPILRDRCVDSPGRLALLEVGDIYDLLRPLGFGKRRALFILELARHFAFGRWPPESYVDVLGLPGCGAYASDSWAIFVEDRLDTRASDKELIRYLECMNAHLKWRAR